MRILALHGRRQTGEILRTRIAGLVKSLRRHLAEENGGGGGLEFVFPDAPHIVAEAERDEGHSGRVRQWASNERTTGEALDTVARAWVAHGPFDAVLGFSEGAAVAARVSAAFSVPALIFACPARSAFFEDADNGWRVHANPGFAPTLHVAGSGDTLVTLESSLSLARDRTDLFPRSGDVVEVDMTSKNSNGDQGEANNVDDDEEEGDDGSFTSIESAVAQFTKGGSGGSGGGGGGGVIFARHGGGHFVPAKAADCRGYASFLRRFAVGLASIDPDARNYESPDVREARLGELETLRAMYDESAGEIEVLSTSPCVAVSLAVRLDGETTAGLRLCVVMSGRYLCEDDPGDPAWFLRHDDLSLSDFPPSLERAMRDAIVAALAESPGFPAVFSMLQAAEDAYTDGAWRSEPIANRGNDEKNGSNADADAKANNGDGEDDADGNGNGGGIALTDAVVDVGPSAGVATHRGGEWPYAIGLIGKPSAGKSTLFNAATGGEAETSARPFTTIDPNRGVGYFSIPCPCSIDGFLGPGLGPKRCDAEHGHTADGKHRLHPVTIIDVAGLVPGARDGVGKGNQFLNDLVSADALVHVVDGSGTTDDMGVLDQTTEHDTPGNTAGDPVREIGWIREEVHAWILGNVRAKWPSIKRRPEKLMDMFSGYHASRAAVRAVVEAAGGIDPKTGLLASGAGDSSDQQGIGKCDSNTEAYDDALLKRVVSTFVATRFPVVAALNKADVPGAEFHEPRVAGLPGLHAVPCTASGESLIRRVAPSIGRGARPEDVTSAIGNSEMHEDIERVIETMRRLGSTGVLRVLTEAVNRRPPLVVFPVADLSTGAAGHGARDAPILPHAVLMKPGSTPGDLFRVLSHGPWFVLRGEFVRADVRLVTPSTSKSVSRTMRRDEPFPYADGETLLVRISTTKKSVWQEALRRAGAGGTE